MLWSMELVESEPCHPKGGERSGTQPGRTLHRVGHKNSSRRVVEQDTNLSIARPPTWACPKRDSEELTSTHVTGEIAARGNGVALSSSGPHHPLHDLDW